ncbi:MAG: alpha/beta hydrolase [Acidobacteriaceae bacterium]
MARTPEELHRSNKDPSAASGQQTRNMPTRDDLPHQLDHAEVVSGRWLVKAILLVLAAAGVALYLTVCLLFYQGQWQFTFFPPRRVPPTAAAIAASSGLPITDVRFDTTEEGVEQLDGWWIPAAPDSGHPSSQAGGASRQAVLFCPDGHADLAGNVDTLKALHALGVNVFAFDYQGFGASQSGHPSQQKAYANGVAALNYLAGIRHVPPADVVVYGARLGAAVAVHVAQHSSNIAGLILEDPQPSLAKEVKQEQHIHLLPMWLVFQDRFAISETIASLKMPKLILSTPAMRRYAFGTAHVYQKASAPKLQLTVESQPVYLQPEWRTAVGNFLNSLAHEAGAAATQRVP